MPGGENPQPHEPGGADLGPPGKPDAPRARLRFPWLTLFFFAGLVAILATVEMAVDFWAGLPWFALTAPWASLAAYRIWRPKHPGVSARRALASFLAIPAGAFVPALVFASPTLTAVVVAIGLGYFAVVLILLLIFVRFNN